jgi:hypothetical protein
MHKARNLIMASAIAGALTLAGCGGGGSSSAANTAITGAVADGYLKGVTVCLDTNANGKCDAGEPSDTTKTGGTYSLSASAADAAKYPIVAEVTTAAIDEDTNVAVDKPYTLMSPPGAKSGSGQVYVTPMSTLVQNSMAQNPNLKVGEAETAVKAQLGYTPTQAVSLFENYITGTGDYVRIRQIAQVAARVIAANKEAMVAAVTQASLTPADLSKPIMQKAVADAASQLSNIQTVADDATKFDTKGVIKSETDIQAAIQSGNVKTTYDSNTIKAELDQVQLMAGATASNTLAALQDGTYNFWYGINQNGASTTYQLWRDTMKANAAGTQMTGSEAKYIPGSGPATGTGWTVNTANDLVLVNGSWQAKSNNETCSLQSQSDGSINFVCNDGTTNVRISSVDIAGRSVAAFVTPTEATAAYTPGATFSQGAKAYMLTIVPSADSYHINDAATTGYGTLAQLLQLSDPDQLHIGDSFHQFSVVFSGTSKTGAVGESGTATFYTGTQGSRITAGNALPISGSWRVVSISGQTLLMVEIPPAYKGMSSLSDGFGQTMFFAVVSNAVLHGSLSYQGVPMTETDFNSVAAQDMLRAFDVTKAAP